MLIFVRFLTLKNHESSSFHTKILYWKDYSILSKLFRYSPSYLNFKPSIIPFPPIYFIITISHDSLIPFNSCCFLYYNFHSPPLLSGARIVCVCKAGRRGSFPWGFLSDFLFSCQLEVHSFIFFFFFPEISETIHLSSKYLHYLLNPSGNILELFPPSFFA